MCSSSSCFCVIPRRQEPSGIPRDSIMLGGQSSPAQTRLRRDLRAKRRGAHMRARSRPKNLRYSSSFAVQTMCSSSSCFCVIPRRQEPSGVPRDGIMLGGQSPPAQTRLRRDLRAKRRGAHMRARSRPKNLRYSSSFAVQTICSSSSCFCVTSEGAPMRISCAFLFIGNGIISRMDSSPASSMTMRSTPGAMPA